MTAQTDNERRAALDLELIEAVELKDLDRVKELIANGAKVNSYRGQAIRQACLNGQLDMVDFLIKNGADVNVEQNDCIRWSCSLGFIDVVKSLVAAGSNVPSVCLTDACTTGRLDVVNFLLGLDVDAHAENDRAIHCAAMGGHLDVVISMLEAAYQGRPCPECLDFFIENGTIRLDGKKLSDLAASEVMGMLVAVAVKKEITEGS